VVRNVVLRQIYRVGYRVLWVSSFVVKRRGLGAKCALFNDGEVLLVRHTYGPREWELPGGGLHRDEDPLSGIRREISEELGVELAQPTALGTGTGLGRVAAARVSYFSAVLPDRTLTPDPVEIAEVAWWDPASLPKPLGWHAAQLLARHGESLASHPSDPGSPERG
jgi:8-oxo-dGTP pyrophosphatase MutT (NUDIX family)